MFSCCINRKISEPELPPSPRYPTIGPAPRTISKLQPLYPLLSGAAITNVKASEHLAPFDNTWVKMRSFECIEGTWKCSFCFEGLLRYSKEHVGVFLRPSDPQRHKEQYDLDDLCAKLNQGVAHIEILESREIKAMRPRSRAQSDSQLLTSL